MCSPARAQIFTGKLSGESGKRKRGNLMYKLPLNETSIAEILRREGYATGFIGKWHLSPHGVDTPRGFVPPGPARQGFDEWAAVEVPAGHFNAKYFTDTPEPIRGFSCDVETDLAIRFIESHRDRPFFLAVSWNPPHNPYTPPREFDVYEPAAMPLRPNVPERFHGIARKLPPPPRRHLLGQRGHRPHRHHPDGDRRRQRPNHPEPPPRPRARRAWSG